jgi:hypothetical protein
MKKLLYLFLIVIGWSGVTFASCSRQNDECVKQTTGQSEIQAQSKQDDPVWNQQEDINIDSNVKRINTLYASAKKLGEEMLSSPSAEVTPRGTEGAYANWCLTQGDTLSRDMQHWAEQAHWNVKWNSDYDYSIDNSFCISGSYQKALNTIAKSYQSANRVLRLDIYPHQSVVVFSTK